MTKRNFTIIDDTTKHTLKFSLQEAIVDIDSSCIELCNMFPPKVLPILHKLFPAPQKTAWEVVQQGEEFSYTEVLHVLKVQDIANVELVSSLL